MTINDCNRLNQVFNSYTDFKELFSLGGYFVQPHVMHFSMPDCTEKNLWHDHRAFEYSIHLSGKMRYFIEEHSIDIGAGDAVIIPAGTLHHWEVLEQPVVFGLMIHLTCQGEGSRMEMDRLRTAVSRHNFKISGFNEGMELVARIEATANRKLGYINEKLRCLSREMIIAFFDAMIPQTHRTITNRDTMQLRGGNPRNLADAVTFYIRDNSYRQLSASEVSAYVGVSINHLNNILKKYTGNTIGQAIWNRKIFIACNLLETTNRQIKDIAASLGIEDVGYFCRRFRRLTGETPGTYRMRIRLGTTEGEE